MQIKINILQEGPGPSEKIVGITTKEGQEQVVLSSRALVKGYLNVGEPLLSENSMHLVELPRETASGKWRVWIPQAEIVENQSAMVPAE